MRSAVDAKALRDSSFCPQPNRIYVLVAAILASALGFIDGSIVSIAIPAIRADLGASLTDAQWISNAYALMLSALILTGGAAGDRFGLRNTFTAGIAAFIVASVLCAIAPGPASLIAARALQGVGAAIMVPGSLAIIAKAYPKNERGKAIGIWAAASALTTALGPVAGGLLLAFDDRVWRLIFAVNLPLGGLAIYLLLAKVPVDAPGKSKALDLVGALLATAALGALAYGLTAMTPESGGVGLGLLLALIGAGVALMGIFLFWETRQRQPLVDLSLFRIRSFAGANAATFLLYFALAAILFYLPMLLIGGWGLSPASAGFIFLPLSVSIALLSGLAGRWSDRAGARLPIAAGSLLAAVAFAGLAVLAGLGVHRFWSGVFPLMVLFGLGMALVVSPLSTAIMTAVADEQTGSASGINNAVSRVAGLMAIACMGAVAAWRYASITGEGGPMPGFGQPAAVPLAPALETLRIAASDSAFAAVAWVTAALCLAAAITAVATVSGRVARSDPAPPSLEPRP